MRSLFLAAALAAASSSLAHAQTCDGDPQFAAHRTANGVVRAQYNAVTRGEWPEAIHFGLEVVESGGAPGHKVAAYTNLCAAYAATGELEQALAACDSALELRGNAWRAMNNRGAVLWLAGRSRRGDRSLPGGQCGLLRRGRGRGQSGPGRVCQRELILPDSHGVLNATEGRPPPGAGLFLPAALASRRLP